MSIKWVFISVSDLSKSLRFYTEVLGLSHLSWLGDRVVLGVAGGPPLLILEEKRGGLPKPEGMRGLYHFALLVPSRLDLARMFLRLAEFWEFEGASDHLVSEALYLRDPDGHGIEVYADRPSTAWSREKGGPLRMATLPLNLDSLLRELMGEGNRVALSDGWKAPPATRVGHIHLHVSRLERAEEFYHRLLGFDITYRLTGSALFMSAGSYHHHIGVNTWAGVDAPPPSEKHVRLESFAINLGGAEWLREVRAKLVEKGVVVDDGLVNSLEGYVGFTVKDFDDNIVELVAVPGLVGSPRGLHL
ncbi:MAG: VOC family protein [Nitrososphaerota archaeon]